MKVCYNKLWKLLIDKGMKKSQLRVAVGASKSTFAKLGKNENVTLPFNNRGFAQRNGRNGQ